VNARLLAGRYQIGAIIGRGGMSDVYNGTDTRLGRTIAIKLLKPSLAADPAFRTRFRQEAQSASRMAHPTIVRVFDAGEETVVESDGTEIQQPFIIMELVSGLLLKKMLADGPLDSAEAIRIAEGILTALEYSHRAGVVHRDIKPGNIMITTAGQVKVMDFGIARAISDSSATVAQTTAILGTASYFSPEQAKGETVDARTDLYSTGVVLFEMLTGRPPFRGETPVAVAYQHVSERPATPSTINPRVSPALDMVTLHALEKNRFERFQNAAEFRDTLHTAGSGQTPQFKSEIEIGASLYGAPPITASGSERALQQIQDDAVTPRTQSRPPVVWLWAGIASVVVIVLALLIWVLTLNPTKIAPDTTRRVPALVGASYDSAASTLKELNLIPSRFGESSSDVPMNQVIRTEPTQDNIVSQETVVKVYVSTGPQTATVPDVVNQKLPDAVTMLTSANLADAEVTKENSPLVPANTVLRSDPAAGSTMPVNGRVNLVVSTGKVTVRDLTGQAIEVASGLLTASNLQLIPDIRPDSTCVSKTGALVSSQSPGPGEVPQKSTVVLRYCTG